MNLQEQISRMKSMMGVINEDKVTDYIHNNFDMIFDELELIKTEDNKHKYDWIDKNGEIVFKKYLDYFWIYSYDQYDELKLFPTAMGFSCQSFQEKLIRYLNTKYKIQFGDEKPLKGIANEDCDEKED